MKDKKSTPTNEEIGQRARDLARQARGRIFVSREGVYLIRGLPEFKKLRICLSAIREPPPESEAPTPLDLGFSADQISRLSAEQLTTWGRGIQKWRKILDAPSKQGKKAGGRQKKHRRWSREMEELSQNLEYLWETLRLWEDGKPIDGQPYPREHSNNSDLKYSERKKVENVDPLWIWLEDLVEWLAEPKAALRFRESLRPYWGPSDREELEYVRDILEKFKSLQHCPRPERESRARNIMQDFRADLGSIPILREIDFQQWFDESISIRKVMGGLEKLVSNLLRPHARQIGSTAALCALDGGEAPIPDWLLSPCNQPTLNEKVQWLESLYGQSGKQGYDALLYFCSDDTDFKWYLYYPDSAPSDARKFLISNIERDDILWALEFEPESSTRLAERKLSPQPFRLLSNTLRRAGLDFSKTRDSSLYRLIVKSSNATTYEIVKQFAVWVSTIDPRVLDPGLAKWAWNTLCDLVALAGARPPTRHRLMEWADPPIDKALSESGVKGVSHEIALGISRLGFYQLMCGEEPRLPRSVRRIMDSKDREERELQRLQGFSEAGELSEGAAARLQLLEARKYAEHVADEKRILRKIQEATAHCALQAVRKLAKDEAHNAWANLMIVEPPKHLCESDVLAFVAWAAGLDRRSKRALHELLESWQKHGQSYRKGLSLNLPWVKVAQKRLDIDQWLSPDSIEITIEDQRIRVGVSEDPFRTLLMGSYFGTCLSLHRFNSKAALANAYDANKNVVFVLDSSGNVIARKLICISSDFKLIGYRTYGGTVGSLPDDSARVIRKLIDAYCGQLARRIGVELENNGSVAESGLFWHDDGSWDWDQIAKATWSDPAATIDPLVLVGKKLMPAVLSALELHQEMCRHILSELGVVDTSSPDNVRNFTALPGLAEESLAILARDRGDAELASLLRDSAITYGGWVEAVTSGAVVEKSAEAYEELVALARKGDLECDRALHVLHLIRSNLARAYSKRITVHYLSNGFQKFLATVISRQTLVDMIGVLDAAELFDEEINGYLAADNWCNLHDKSLPPSLAYRRLVQFLKESESFDEAFELVQWLPVDFRGIQKRKSVSDQRLFPSSIRRNRAEMSKIIAALQRPCSSSVNYLKQESDRNPLALLGFALSCRERHRAYIQSEAIKVWDEPASMLAFLLFDNADAFMERVFGNVSHTHSYHREKVLKIQGFVESFEKLHFDKTPVDFYPVLKRGDLPALVMDKTFALGLYILYWLWRWLDQKKPQVESICAFVNSKYCMILLEYSAVNVAGLCFRLATLLGRAEREDVDRLGEALVKLRHGLNRRILAVPETDVMLQILSNERYFTFLERSESTPACLYGQNLGGVGTWEFLVDERGKPHGVIDRLYDLSECNEIRLPHDSRVAHGFLAWLKDKVDNKGYSEWQKKKLVDSITPLTEIQRQMVKRYLGESSDQAN